MYTRSLDTINVILVISADSIIQVISEIVMGNMQISLTLMTHFSKP